MDLTNQINLLNQKADIISAGIHSPLRKEFKVIRGYETDTEYVEEEITLVPNPIVTNVRPRDIGVDFGNSESSGALRLSAMDLVAKVPRIYPASLFVKSDTSRVQVTVNGERHSVLHVDESNCCYYIIYLRRLLG
jgi:hypothetical protein